MFLVSNCGKPFWDHCVFSSQCLKTCSFLVVFASGIFLDVQFTLLFLSSMAVQTTDHHLGTKPLLEFKNFEILSLLPTWNNVSMKIIERCKWIQMISFVMSIFACICTSTHKKSLIKTCEKYDEMITPRQVAKNAAEALKANVSRTPKKTYINYACWTFKDFLIAQTVQTTSLLNF